MKTKTTRGMERVLWPAWYRQLWGLRSGCRELRLGAQCALLCLLGSKP